MFFLARYLKGNKKVGKEYTFKANFGVRPGDTVLANGKKVFVVEGETDEDFIRSFGDENIVSVERMEDIENGK